MRKDMEYLFECSTRYLMSERGKQVRYMYKVELEKRYSYLQTTKYYLVYYINILIATF